MTDTRVLRWLLRLPLPTRVLITSRSRRPEFLTTAVQLVELGGMDKAEASRLIQERAVQVGLGVAPTPNEQRQLYALTEGSPLGEGRSLATSSAPGSPLRRGVEPLRRYLGNHRRGLAAHHRAIGYRLSAIGYVHVMMCEPPIHALLAVADPTDWPPAQPEPVDLPGEVERARVALGDIPTTVLPAPCSGARATLINVGAALRDAPQICYLVGHALLVQGTPCLWLEQPDGSGAPVAATTLAAQLAHADYRPPLVVLSAYAEVGSPDDMGALAAVGLGLAQAGLPAVLVVSGSSPAATMDRFLAIFFRALRREGRLDRALAVARDAVPAPGDQPVLFLRDVE